MSIKTCGFCKHWRRNGLELKLGHCRRYPPTSMLFPGRNPGEIQLKAVFPPAETTTAACGEFVLSSEPDPDEDASVFKAPIVVDPEGT